jgi:Trypsin-like peptidase domain
MKVLLTAALCAASILFGNHTSGIQPAHGFEAQAMNATVAIIGAEGTPGTKDFEEHFMCSAFVAQKLATGYLLLSAGHCVSDVPSDVQYYESDTINGTRHQIVPVTARLTDDEDVVMFFYETKQVYPVLELGDESSDSIGDEILNPNFAEGWGKQLALGHIASQQLTDISHDLSCSMCHGVFMVHEFAGPGASGSPVISVKTHKVIGILTLELKDDGFGVEPISVVKRALTHANQYKEIHNEDFHV